MALNPSSTQYFVAIIPLALLLCRVQLLQTRLCIKNIINIVIIMNIPYLHEKQ